MNKIEILKELIIMVKKKNYRCAWGVGSRSDTSEDLHQRSKDMKSESYYISLKMKSIKTYTEMKNNG